jgi:hypothetical protein
VKEACQEAFWRKPSTNINSVSKFQNFWTSEQACIPPPPNSLVITGKTTRKGNTSVPQFVVTKAGRTEQTRSSTDSSELYSADAWF